MKNKKISKDYVEEFVAFAATIAILGLLFIFSKNTYGAEDALVKFDLTSSNQNGNELVFLDISNTYSSRGWNVDQGLSYFSSNEGTKLELLGNLERESGSELNEWKPFGFASLRNDDVLNIKNRYTIGFGVSQTFEYKDFDITPSYALLYENNKFKNSLRFKAKKQVGYFYTARLVAETKLSFVDNEQTRYITSLEAILGSIGLGWSYDYSYNAGKEDSLGRLYLTWELSSLM